MLVTFLMISTLPETAYCAGSKDVKTEAFGKASSPLLVLLHGASGPSGFYRQQAMFFAAHGYRVLLPHFLDWGNGTGATDQSYALWSAAVVQVISKNRVQSNATPYVLVGYSLGASVALAIGSEAPQEGPSAIAEFSGSLPDRYYRDMKGRPSLLILHGKRDGEIPVSDALQIARLCSDANLTCVTQIYPEEGHIFSPDALKNADERVLQFFEQVVPGK